MKGRRLDGLTTLSKEGIVDFLMAFVEDQSTAGAIEGREPYPQPQTRGR